MYPLPNTPSCNLYPPYLAPPSEVPVFKFGLAMWHLPVTVPVIPHVPVPYRYVPVAPYLAPS
jgi:hypothetical protein